MFASAVFSITVQLALVRAVVLYSTRYVDMSTGVRWTKALKLFNVSRSVAGCFAWVSVGIETS